MPDQTIVGSLCCCRSPIPGGRSVTATRKIFGFTDFNRVPNLSPFLQSTVAPPTQPVDTDNPMTFRQGRRYQAYSETLNWLQVQAAFPPYFDVEDNRQPGQTESGFEYEWTVGLAMAQPMFTPQPPTGRQLTLNEAGQPWPFGQPSPGNLGFSTTANDPVTEFLAPVLFDNIPSSELDTYWTAFIADSQSFQGAQFQQSGPDWTAVTYAVNGTVVQGETYTINLSYTAAVSQPVDYNQFVDSILAALQWNPQTRHFVNPVVDALFQSRPYVQLGIGPHDTQYIGFNDPAWFDNPEFPTPVLPDFSAFDGQPELLATSGFFNPNVEQPGAFGFPPSYVITAIGDNNVSCCISQVQVTGSYTITEYTVMTTRSAAGLGFFANTYSLINPVLVRTGNATGLVTIPPPGVSVSGADTASEAWTISGFNWDIPASLYHSQDYYPIGKVRQLTQP